VADAIGRRRWVIAEGYIPPWSHGPEPQMTSQESACVLNANDQDAHVAITLFFADREPAGPYRVTVPASEPGTSASISWTTPSRFRRTRTMPACSNRTCRSWSSTPGWTRARPALLSTIAYAAD
jgi:hypothetical protein